LTVEETHSLCLCPSSATAARLDLTHAEDRLRNKRSAVSLADLRLAVKGVLGVSIAGSLALFAVGVAMYLPSIISLSIIMIAAQVSSMLLFALLVLPVFIIRSLLGSTTPLESMPETLQRIMQFSPSTHFVSFAQAVLYRGAGLDVIWQDSGVIAALGLLFFAVALMRFRRMLVQIQA
jgi:ABC-2 type transport system permease protein